MKFPYQLRHNTRNFPPRTYLKTDYKKLKQIDLQFYLVCHFNGNIYLLFVEFESVFPPRCTVVVSTMFSLNLGESPLLLLLTMLSSSCILGAIILAKTYKQTRQT